MNTLLSLRNSFEADLNWAANRHNKLLDKGKVSVELGQTAILYSTHANPNDFRFRTREQQAAYFEQQAYMLRDKYIALGRSEVSVRKGNRETFRDALRNTDISHIALIGHGSINSIIMPTHDKYKGAHCDWLLLARRMQHLKTAVESYTCGHFPLENNVALGTFLAVKPTGVMAAVGKYLPYSQNLEPQMIESVYRDDVDLIPQIYELNKTHRQEAAMSRVLSSYEEDKAAMLIRENQTYGVPLLDMPSFQTAATS